MTDLFDPLTPANPAAVAPKCRRHQWERSVAGGMPWPARCVHCPLVTEDPDAYFYPRDWDEENIPYERLCPVSPDGVHEADTTIRCIRCGKVRDESVRRRNRNNRSRGATFERSVAKQLGGRRTGPLGGRDDVMVGAFSAIQTKKTERLSLNEARAYLDDLTRTYPDRVPLVVHAKPGPKPDAVVILPLRVWVELHGEGER